MMSFLPAHIFTIARGNSSVPLENIVPLVRGTEDPQLLMVRSDGSLGDVEQIKLATQSQRLKFGGTHVGGMDHVTVILFARRAGLEIPTYIPFKSAAEVITALVGGAIDVAVLNYSEAEPQIRAGDVEPVVVFADEPLPVAPDVPTARQAGMDLDLAVVRGLAVLKGVPDEVVATLEDGFLRAMESEAYQSYLANSGMSPESVAGREEWTAQVNALVEQYREVAEDVAATAE